MNCSPVLHWQQCMFLLSALFVSFSPLFSIRMHPFQPKSVNEWIPVQKNAIFTSCQSTPFNFPYLLKPLKSIKYSSPGHFTIFKSLFLFTVIYLFYSCLPLVRLLPLKLTLILEFCPIPSKIQRIGSLIFGGRGGVGQNIGNPNTKNNCI